MTDLRTNVTVTRREERPSLLWMGGTVYDVVLGGDQTGGAFALLEQRGRAGDATPLHVHRSEAEVFYVLEGAATAWFGDDVTSLGVGAAVYLPPGLPHALRMDADGTRVLTLSAPAGFADFIREAGVPVRGDLPATWQVDRDRVMAAAPKHGIDVLGPPPGVPPHR